MSTVSFAWLIIASAFVYLFIVGICLDHLDRAAPFAAVNHTYRIVACALWPVMLVVTVCILITDLGRATARRYPWDNPK